MTAAWRIDQPRPGYWLVRCCRHCPVVAARIWLCDHEPGYPEHKIDRPYLQGQIGLDLVDPHEIWAMLEFCEASPEEKRLMEAPPLSSRERAGARGNRQPGLVTAPMSLWKRHRARRISAADYERQIAWLKWAEKHRPQHPDFTYRKPVSPAAMAIPRF